MESGGLQYKNFTDIERHIRELEAQKRGAACPLERELAHLQWLEAHYRLAEFAQGRAQ